MLCRAGGSDRLDIVSKALCNAPSPGILVGLSFTYLHTDLQYMHWQKWLQLSLGTVLKGVTQLVHIVVSYFCDTVCLTVAQC